MQKPGLPSLRARNGGGPKARWGKSSGPALGPEVLHEPPASVCPTSLSNTSSAWELGGSHLPLTQLKWLVSLLPIKPN